MSLMGPPGAMYGRFVIDWVKHCRACDCVGAYVWWCQTRAVSVNICMELTKNVFEGTS